MLYNYLYYFTIYAFAGWCMESTYAKYKTGHWINRGFLHGPFCPIYGVGAVAIIAMYQPIQSLAISSLFMELAVAFLYAVFITSALEYVTGFILETLFKTTWWDYNDRKFNIKGRVCLFFSIVWGCVALILIYFIHPTVMGTIDAIPKNTGNMILFAFVSYFSIDLILTVHGLYNFLHIMEEMQIVAVEYRDELKDNIEDKLEEFAQSGREFKSEIANFRTDVSMDLQIRRTVLSDEFNIKREQLSEEKEQKKKELLEKYEALNNRLTKNHKRMVIAFPNIKSQRFSSIIDRMKDKLNQRFDK